MPSKLVRWLPAVVAPVVVAGAVAIPITAAAAPPQLPAKSAAQVLALVAKAKSVSGFSGTVTQTSALGLPEVSSLSPGGDSDTGSALETLTGDHTARVWVAGDEKSRVAVLDSTGERDVVRNGDTVWTWDSEKKKAVQVRLEGAAARAPHASTTTPQEAADELLQRVGPTTTTSVTTAQRVAGRDAYTLSLAPKTDATTIGSIRLAVDAATGLPLRVQAFARGASSPAAEVAFSSISYGTPSADRFAFTPPSDATVQRRTVEALTAAERRAHASSAPRPTVTGEGWTAIAEYDSAPSDALTNPTVQRLTTAVDGGRVLHTSLVNVLLTDDGHVLAGAVPVAALQAAAR